jgi:hypothetical protein
MKKSLFLATVALSLSSAIAFAQNAPMSPAKSKQHVARQESATSAKPIYDYAPVRSTSLPQIFGVAY